MRATRAVLVMFAFASVSSTVACRAARPSLTMVETSVVEPMGPPRAAGRSDWLTETELATAKGATAADAIRRLRPEFMRSSAPSFDAAARPSVYVEGKYAGELNVLELIPLRAVVEIRRLDPVAAKNWFGSNCPCGGGVILVRTRR